MVRGSIHPVAQVGRDLGTLDHVLYRWTSQHRQAEAHDTTWAYELNVGRGRREGCILEDWLDGERDILSREFSFSVIPRDGDSFPLIFQS